MSASLSAPPPAMPMPGDAPDAEPDSDVLVTICSDGQGGFIIYQGDEPEGDTGDMSEDDANAMGPAGDAAAPGGGAPTPQGQPADSIGAALKAALDILNAAKSSEGAPGSADDQFAGGFNASKSPTPVGMGPAQKY